MQVKAPLSPVSRRPPSLWLLTVLVYCLIALSVTVVQALHTPWLGLRLAPGPEDTVQVTGSRSEAIPTGARMLSMTTPGGKPLALIGEDIMEEPDMLPDYARLDDFLARQSSMAAMLSSPQVTVQWQREPDLAASVTTLIPRARPWTDLPFLFWFQVGVSITGCLIACWVWVLRPRDWGARMFGLTGLAFPIFVMPAAIYSTREIALAGDRFQLLSQINHWGSVQFGAALGCILLMHPKPMVSPVHMLWYFAAVNLWWLSDALHLIDDPNWGFRAIVFVEMLVAVCLAALQWRRSKGDALSRASLRWLSLSLLVGSGLFITLIISTAALGWLPPMPQGYAFGFFLFIYVGIALGLRRYRLFDLDEWAWRMLWWVGGIVAIVSIDALLILFLDWSQATALGATLWICGAVYFPARQWVWQRLTRRTEMQVHDLMPDVVRIAFQPSRPTQETLWDDLLRRIHDPMLLEVSSFTGTQAALADHGLTLEVPACGGIAARRLRYPSRGQRLFSSKDPAFLNGLCQLMDQAQASRGAYERGAHEERRRIAHDMHDDIGARLLMLIHRANSPDLAELARAAMHDMRTALHSLDAQDMPLPDAIADWRAEASARCEAAQVELTWRAELTGMVGLPALASRQKATIERVLREGLTNALRHARPQRVEIDIHMASDALQLMLRNDGRIGDPLNWIEGRGLQGMRRRLQAWGGHVRIQAVGATQAELVVSVPLFEPQASAEFNPSTVYEASSSGR